MTEIDVVKKSSNAWIWIVIAILVVAALFFFRGRSSSDTRTGYSIDRGDQPNTVVAHLLRA